MSSWFSWMKPTEAKPSYGGYGQKFDPPARGTSPNSTAIRGKSPTGLGASARVASPVNAAANEIRPKSSMGTSSSEARGKSPGEKPSYASSTASSAAKIEEKVERLMNRTSAKESSVTKEYGITTSVTKRTSDLLSSTFKTSPLGSEPSPGSLAKKALVTETVPRIDDPVYGSKSMLSGTDSREEFGFKIREVATEYVTPEPGLPDVGLNFGLSSTPRSAKAASCPSCGNVYMPDADYCRKCGKKRDGFIKREVATPDKAMSDDLFNWKTTPDKVGDSDSLNDTDFLGSIEDIINSRYDPFIDYVKDLTKDVKKATKLLKRDKISNAFGVHYHDGYSIPASPASATGRSAQRGIGDVRVIICALDYVGTGTPPLSCTVDGDNMQELCKAAGITDVSVLYNSQANYEAVAAKIKRVGSRCQPGDCLVFYYAGHGTQVADEDGDEVDGYDEAFCFVTPEGKIDRKAFMTDDQFADNVISSIPEDVKVLVLSDCCHSGTICDFGSNPKWSKTQAVSFSGCKDHQTSADSGKGGIFTHSLLLAIERTRLEGKSFDRIGSFFARVVDIDDEVFDSAQDIHMDASSGTDRLSFPWPIVPNAYYKAPFKKNR